jgi:hypothetical protein
MYQKTAEYFKNRAKPRRYPHPSSLTPEASKYNIVKSQIISYNSLYNTLETFLGAVLVMLRTFEERGYDMSVIMRKVRTEFEYLKTTYGASHNTLYQILVTLYTDYRISRGLPPQFRGVPNGGVQNRAQ